MHTTRLFGPVAYYGDDLRHERCRDRPSAVSLGGLAVLVAAVVLLMVHYLVVMRLAVGTQMSELSDRLNYDREVIRVWFCNKRQALKNTIKKLRTQD